MTEGGYVDAGRLEVQVVADLRGFTRQLRADLEKQAAAASAQVRIGVEVSPAALRTALKAAAKEAGPVTVDVNARLNKQQLRDMLRDAMPREGVDVPIKPKVDPGSKRQAEADIDDLQRRVDRALTGTEKSALGVEKAYIRQQKALQGATKDSLAYRDATQALADAENRHADALARAKKAADELEKGGAGHKDPHVTVQVDADVARARLRIDELTRDRKAEIKVDIDPKASQKIYTRLQALQKIIADSFTGGATTAATKSLNALGNSLGAVGKLGTPLLFAGLATSAAGAVGAVGALAGGLAPMVTTLGLLPGAAVGAGVALATVAVGMNGVGAALKAASAKDLDAYNAALKKLSPSAQTLVKAFVTLQPMLHTFQQTVQEALLKGAGASVMTLATTYLGPGGMLRQAITGTAAAFSTGFRSAAGYLTLASTLQSIHAGFAGVTVASQELARTARPLTSIFVTAFGSAGPFIASAAAGIANFTEKIATFLASARRTGELSRWFETGISVAKQFGRIVVDLTAGLFGFFKAGSGEGRGFLDTIEGALRTFRDFTNSAGGQNAIAGFFHDAGVIAGGLWTTVKELGTVLGGALGLFHKLPDDAKAAAGPVLILAGAFGKLAGAGGGFVKSLSGLISKINTLAAPIQNRAANKMAEAAAAQVVAADTMLKAAGLQDVGAAAGAEAAGGGLLSKITPLIGPIVVAALAVGTIAAIIAEVKKPGTLADSIERSGVLGSDTKQKAESGQRALERKAAGTDVGLFQLRNPFSLTSPDQTERAKQGQAELKAFLAKKKADDDAAADQRRAAAAADTASKADATAADARQKQADTLAGRVGDAQNLLNNPRLKLGTPRVMELKVSIQDWETKKLQVEHEALLLAKNPTTMAITADITNISQRITQVKGLLADPKLTKAQKIALGADLTQLYKDRAEADAVLDIKAKKVEIQGNIDNLELQIQVAKDKLNTVPHDQKVAVEGEISGLEAQLALAKGELSADWIVNPTVVEIQARIDGAQDRIAQIQAELKTKIPQKTRTDLTVELKGLQAGINQGVKDLATLPEFTNQAGQAAGNSFGAGLAAVTPALRLKGLQAALAAAEGIAAFNAKYIAKPGNYSSANAAEHAADALRSQQNDSVARIKAQIAEANAAIKAADAAAPPITGATTGFTSKTQQAAAKQAASQAASAAKQREAAAAAAAKAAAARAAAAAQAAATFIARGFTAGITGTLPQIQAASFKMADYLKTALGSKAGGITAVLVQDTKQLEAMAKARATIITSLTAAQSKLAALRTQSATLAASIATQVKQSFTLVDTGGGNTIAGITDRLTKAVAAAKDFATSVAAARTKGLSSGLLEQLASAGPVAGAGTAHALAGATADQIAQINKLNGALNDTATKTGSTVADALYGSGIQAAQGLVNGLLSKKADADAAMVALADTLTGAIRRALGIKSPSTVTAALGAQIGAGLNNGLAGTAATLQITADTMMTALTATFANGVKSIASAWSGIQAAARNPVKFVIDTVINGALLGAYNAIAKQFGVAQVPAFKAPKGFAEGGVYPGYSPGRDTGIIAVGGGEAIIRPEGTRALGAEWVHGINTAARRGGVEGARKFLGGFADGGLVPALTAFAQKSGVPFSVTSGYRPGDPGYHGRGMAVDMASSAGNMVKLAGWLYGRYKNLLELIHSGGGGFFVKNGQKVGADYYRSVIDEHFSHVHLAMNAAGLAAAGAAPGVGVDLAGGLATSLTAALTQATSKTGKAPFAGVVNAVAQAASNVLAGPGGAAMSGTNLTLGLSADVAGSPALAGLPAGVTRWAGTVQQVLSMLGQPAGLLGAVLRRIKFESGGNPGAVNLTDSNARAGHPSQGLMQTIPSTFAHWAGQFAARGITDPIANIYAGLNYALHRYGSIGAIDPLVRPYGYDAGGVLQPGTSLVHNGTGRPEAIFTGGQFDRLIGALAGLAGQATSGQLRSAGRLSFSMATGGDGATAGRPGGGVVVNVHPRQGQSEQEIGRIAAREIEWARGAAW